MNNTLSLDNYRVANGGLSLVDEIIDNGTGAPFVNTAGPDPSQQGNNFEEYAEFHSGTSGITGAALSRGTIQPHPQASGPIVELINVAVAYSRLNPNDLSHMLERIRLTNKMSELVPVLKAEAEQGRQAILVELGLAEAPKPKRVRKPAGGGSMVV